MDSRCDGERALVLKKMVAPSILSADFVNFERDFGTIANSDLIHVDVMDGHFVPNLSFGPPVIAALRKLDPLMRNNYRNQPVKLAEWFSASRVERTPKKAEPAAPTA